MRMGEERGRYMESGGMEIGMNIGERLRELRKLSGLTQEQLAGKLDVSRQTVSKWEAGASIPDLESIVKFCRLFQVSLDDLLLEAGEDVAVKEEKITIKDLIRLNTYHQRMTMILTGSLMFLMVGVLSAIFIMVMQKTTTSIEYMLYRYITVGEYANAPVDYARLFIPSCISFLLGAVLCVCYCRIKRRGEKK